MPLRALLALLIPLGLIFYAVGAFLQIYEHWIRRGLSDTSYRSLFFLIVGPGCIAAASLVASQWLYAGLSGLPAILALWIFGLKTRDFVRTRYKVMRPHNTQAGRARRGDLNNP